MSHVNICHIFSTNVLFGKRLYSGIIWSETHSLRTVMVFPRHW